MYCIISITVSGWEEVNEELKRFRHFDGMTLSNEMHGVPFFFINFS